MESISQNIDQLLEDIKRVVTLLDDAARDAELLDAQPYQQARVMALRRQLFDIELRLMSLRREIALAKLSVHEPPREEVEAHVES